MAATVVLTSIVAVKAILIVALAVVSWWRLTRSTTPRGGVANLVGLAAAAGSWCAVSIWASFAPESNQLLGAAMTLVVSASAIAALLVTWQITQARMYPPTWLLVGLIVTPWLLALGDLLGIGADASSYRTGVIFNITKIGGMSLVMLSLSMLARRLNDDDARVRRWIPAFQLIILVIAFTELRDLNIASIFAAVAAIAVLLLSTNDTAWIAATAAPRNPSLLDDIGAFVLAFDRHGRLVAWNDPAAELIVGSGRPAPKAGMAAQEVLGLEVPLTGRQIIKFDSPDGVITTVGYTTQPATHKTAEDAGWVVVLRTSAEESGPRSKPVLPLSLNHRDETTGTLSRASIIERIRRALRSRSNVGVIRVDVVGSLDEDMTDVAMRALAEGLDEIRAGMVIGRLERLTFAVLLPDATETSEMAARMRGRFDSLEDRFGTSLSVAASVSSQGEDADTFIRKILTAPELVDRVRWQPRWY